jgi:hypothetical protein
LACGESPSPSATQTRLPATDDQSGLPSVAKHTVTPLGDVTEGEPDVLCAEGQPLFITDFQVRQTPDVVEPTARTPYRDPVFGTCVVRVTDRDTDLSPDDDSAGLKNEYSRVQSFNADGTRLLARGIEGTWYLYDADTLSPLAQLPLEVEPRWDPADPDTIFFSDETRLMAYRISTGQRSLVRDFASDLSEYDLAAVWTRYEGRPSADGRIWGLMAEDEDWETVAFVVYDREVDQVVALRDVHSLPGVIEGIDHVTISSLGTYFLASFDRSCPEGQLGDDDHPCGLMVYDNRLAHGRSLLRTIGHYDVALDASGREVVVFQDIDEDTISLLDLASGALTPLWPIDFSHTALGFHFSGCAFARPGWALVSTHDGDPGAHTWMDDQVFAVQLKAGGQVVRLVHTHSLVDEDQEHDYWAEPHASVNPGFTRILFTSNWGRSGTGEVDMFLVELPRDWPDRLP